MNETIACIGFGLAMVIGYVVGYVSGARYALKRLEKTP
jgi:hypothetical protein